MSTYLTISELVEYSHLSERYLRGLIASGELRHFRTSPNGKILVRQDWFDDYADRKSHNPADAAAIRLVDKLMGKVG